MNLQQKQQNNIDIDFIEDEIEKYLLSPDIKHLQKMFLPKNKRKTKTKSVDIKNTELLFSVAVGDAIGSRFEFTEHDYNVVNDISLITEASDFTDDTVLSFATKQAVDENPKKPDFRKAYLEAYKNFPDAGYGATFSRWAEEIEISNKKGYGSFANGSAMRVAYIGAYYDKVKNVIKHAIESSMVTHNHQDGIKGAVVTAVIIWMLKNGYSKDDVYEYAKQFYSFNDENKQCLLHSEKYFFIDTNLNNVSNSKSRTSLFANYAVPFAIKCFLETNSYKECMREILKHFCDTDTICAIAGGFCYTYYQEINLSKEDMINIKAKFSSWSKQFYIKELFDT